MNSFVSCSNFFSDLLFRQYISHEFPVIVLSLFFSPSSLRFRAKFFGDENGFLDCEDITFARLEFHKHSCPRNYL